MDALLHEDSEGEQMFSPLEKYLERYCDDIDSAANVMSNYRYIQHDSDGVYYYRHYWTNKYLLIDGKSLEIIVGKVDYRRFQEKIIDAH